MSAECRNEEWAAENNESVEWARTMWYCPCASCVAVPEMPRLKASAGTLFSEQVSLHSHKIILAPGRADD